MKKLLKIKYLMATIIVLFIAGCTEDFLDIKPAGKPDEDSFFADTANIDLMVSGIYNSFLYKEGCDIYDMVRWALGDVASDMSESGGDSPTAWGEIYSFDEMSFNAESSILKSTYGSMFNGVNRAAKVIERLTLLKENSSNDLKKKIDIRLGEAYFLRAANYFILARVFGGVPVVDHVFAPSDFYSNPRGTIKEVYNLMEQDLKAAINLLPTESQIPVSDKGRASKGAAQALLAKMYVYESSYFSYYGSNDPRMGDVQNRWQEAYDLTKEIINSAEYELISGTSFSTFWNQTATNGFRYLFSVEGNNNRESIFAIQHILSSGYDNYGFGGALNQYVGPRALIHKDGTFNQGDHAWGFWVPNHKLYNLFDPNDVRRKVAIGQGPDPITGYPGDSVYGEIADVQGFYTIANTTYQATGLENMKYEIGPFNSMMINGSFQGNNQNMYFIRYADVVLLAAEAAMMTGKSAEALTCFNMIRTRARNCGDGVHPADLAGVVTKKEIMDERAREFAMEGERFFDLVRWKEAYNELNGSRMEWWDNSYANLSYEEPKNDFFPLPAIELQKNNALKQYTGW